MTQSNPVPSAPAIGLVLPLLLYLVGYGCVGYLIAVPTDALHRLMLLISLGSVGLLAWAGAEAGAGGRSRSFGLAVLAALVLGLTLGWAVATTGAKVAAGAVTGSLVWATAWLVTLNDEEAVPLALLLVLLAIGLWVAGAGVLVSGIVFVFVACSSVAIGERVGQYVSSITTFAILIGVAELGLLLGWVVRRIYW